MRRPPPPHPRGASRTPGSGRKKGTPNRKTVELRQLMAALAGDVDYQERFRRAFVKRRLHPSTEIKVWEYALGKPKEQIEMSAKLSMDARLAAEREVFAQLDIEDLEVLAAESQSLVDRAISLVNARRLQPADAALPGAVLTDATTIDLSTAMRAGSGRGVPAVRRGAPPRDVDLAAVPCAESADPASSDEPAAARGGVGDHEAAPLKEPPGSDSE